MTAATIERSGPAIIIPESGSPLNTATVRETGYLADPYYGALSYWDCITNRMRVLLPTEPIPDRNLLISKIGQQNILPGHLAFKASDRKATQIATEDGRPIGDKLPPALSGFIFFGSVNPYSDGTKPPSEDSLRPAAELIGKTVHKKSRLHVTQVRDIVDAGWTVYFAPLIDQTFGRGQRHPLHVLMTPNSIAANPDWTSLVANPEFAGPSEAEKEALAKVFVRWG